MNEEFSMKQIATAIFLVIATAGTFCKAERLQSTLPLHSLTQNVEQRHEQPAPPDNTEKVKLPPVRPADCIPVLTQHLKRIEEFAKETVQAHTAGKISDDELSLRLNRLHRIVIAHLSDRLNDVIYETEVTARKRHLPNREGVEKAGYKFNLAAGDKLHTFQPSSNSVSDYKKGALLFIAEYRDFIEKSVLPEISEKPFNDVFCGFWNKNAGSILSNQRRGFDKFDPTFLHTSYAAQLRVLDSKYESSLSKAAELRNAETKFSEDRAKLAPSSQEEIRRKYSELKVAPEKELKLLEELKTARKELNQVKAFGVIPSPTKEFWQAFVRITHRETLIEQLRNPGKNAGFQPFAIDYMHAHHHGTSENREAVLRDFLSAKSAEKITSREKELQGLLLQLDRDAEKDISRIDTSPDVLAAKQALTDKIGMTERERETVLRDYKLERQKSYTALIEKDPVNAIYLEIFPIQK